jgi:hypothetical protein
MNSKLAELCVKTRSVKKFADKLRIYSRPLGSVDYNNTDPRYTAACARCIEGIISDLADGIRKEWLKEGTNTRELKKLLKCCDSIIKLAKKLLNNS